MPFLPAFFSLPLLSIFYHLAISFLPSVSSLLPFYFFLACAYLSALFLFLLALFPFIAFLVVRSSFESLRPFSMFPCSHLSPQIFFSRFRLITPFLSLFLFSLPSYLLPRFSTFGDFNPPSKTPFLPHLARLDPTSRTHLLENSTHLGRQQQ